MEIFDKYEIVRRLAYGGMGEVFLARQGGAARFDRRGLEPCGDLPFKASGSPPALRARM